MKFKATCENIEMFVEIADIPKLQFEEHEIATGDNTQAWVAGAHKWLPVIITTDMSPFFRKHFELESDEWKISGCVVLHDKKSIHYNQAIQKV